MTVWLVTDSCTNDVVEIFDSKEKACSLADSLNMMFKSPFAIPDDCINEYFVEEWAVNKGGRPMTANEYLKKFCKINTISYQYDWTIQLNRPYAVCADGFGVSIQASDCHYCEPRISQRPENEFVPYETVELGYPSAADEDLLPYQECPNREDPTESVYGYIPVSIVDKVLAKHGGIDITATWNYFKEQHTDLYEEDQWWNTMQEVFFEIFLKGEKK